MSVDLKVPSSLSPTVTYRDCPFTPLDGYDMLCLAFVEPMAIFLPCQMALQLTMTVPQWQTTHTRVPREPWQGSDRWKVIEVVLHIHTEIVVMGYRCEPSLVGRLRLKRAAERNTVLLLL